MPDEASETFTVEACGSTVTVSPGDIDEVEYMATDNADGSVKVVDFRGAQTVDVVRESDGATLDELDTSGSGYQIYYHQTVVFSWEGPTIIGAFDEVEAAAFAEAGLPPLFFYTGGRTTETVVFPTEPGPVVSATFTENTAEGVRDVCDMLDEAVA